MSMILITLTVALFSQENASFIKDVEVKRQQNCTFTYVGQQAKRPDVPHISVDNKYIYFSMEPCNK